MIIAALVGACAAAIAIGLSHRLHPISADAHQVAYMRGYFDGLDEADRGSKA